MNDSVLCEMQDQIALLTLNRPDKLNAINYAVVDQLMSLLDAIERDSNIRAVIITGSGNKAFSAGADIHEFSESIQEGANVALKDFVHRGQAMTTRFENFPKPVIAAVNGLAFGGGCELTEATHLAIAVETARFAKSEINIGIPPTFGGTQRLPRLAGRKRALELLLTGDPISADRALEIGLVNKVVAETDLLDEAFSMTKRIIQHSSATISAILYAVTRGINLNLDEGLEVEAQQFARIANDANTQEALSAWKERRKPIYHYLKSQ